MSFLILKGQETFYTQPHASLVALHAKQSRQCEGSSRDISFSKALLSAPQCQNLINCLPSIQSRHLLLLLWHQDRSSVLGCPVCFLEKGQVGCFRPRQTTEKQGHDPISTRSFLKWKKEVSFLTRKRWSVLLFLKIWADAVRDVRESGWKNILWVYYSFSPGGGLFGVL